MSVVKLNDTIVNDLPLLHVQYNYTIQYNRTLLSRKREICVQRSSKS